jgi:hypothetical protein
MRCEGAYAGLDVESCSSCTATYGRPAAARCAEANGPCPLFDGAECRRPCSRPGPSCCICLGEPGDGPWLPRLAIESPRRTTCLLSRPWSSIHVQGQGFVVPRSSAPDVSNCLLAYVECSCHRYCCWSFLFRRGGIFRSPGPWLAQSAISTEPRLERARFRDFFRMENN